MIQMLDPGDPPVRGANEESALMQIRCSIDSIAWTPDGRRCLTGSHRGEFTLWNGSTFKFEGILQVCAMHAINDCPVKLIHI